MATVPEILARPGMPAALWWVWLSDCPPSPAGAADCLALALPGGRVRARESSWEWTGAPVNAGMLTATIPVPPTWSQGPPASGGWGLAILTDAGELVGLVFLMPNARDDTSHIGVRVEVTGGPA